MARIERCWSGSNIDNYRCFVNFELKLGREHLILGGNGSGKSTLLQVLQSIRQLVAGEGEPDGLFPESTRTRWQTRPIQRLELDVKLKDSMYRLLLEIDSWGDPSRRRVKRESVTCDGRPIFEFAEGEVSLFNDRFEQKVRYPFDWHRSALATIQ